MVTQRFSRKYKCIRRTVRRHGRKRWPLRLYPKLYKALDGLRRKIHRQWRNQRGY